MATIATTTTREARRLPWDVMGSALNGADHATVADALAASCLDYQVEVRDLYSARTAEDGTPEGLLQAPSLRTVVRPMPDGSEKVLAAVGTRFTPIDNADAFAVADVLSLEYGARIAGAADFRHGGASLMVVDLQRPVLLDLPGGTVDRTDLSLMIKNAHDGSAALTFAITGVRLECTNAIQAAIRGADRTWKISHTPNAEERVGLARQSIIAAMNYRDAFQEQAQALVDQGMTDREFDKIVARLWPVAEGKADTKAGQRRLEVREEVRGLYATSDTLDGARGTLWGGYNAITEWLDWSRPVRGGDVSRAEGALEGPYVRTKAKVWDLFAGAVRN